MVDQERQRLGDVGTVGKVVVVEHQGDLARVDAELVDDANQHGLYRRLPGPQQGQRRGGGSGDGAVEGVQGVVQNVAGLRSRWSRETQAAERLSPGSAGLRTPGPVDQAVSQVLIRVVLPNQPAPRPR